MNRRHVPSRNSLPLQTSLLQRLISETKVTLQATEEDLPVCCAKTQGQWKKTEPLSCIPSEQIHACFVAICPMVSIFLMIWAKVSDQDVSTENVIWNSMQLTFYLHETLHHQIGKQQIKMILTCPFGKGCAKLQDLTFTRADRQARTLLSALIKYTRASFHSLLITVQAKHRAWLHSAIQHTGPLFLSN